jgi:hypothetical protein
MEASDPSDELVDLAVHLRASDRLRAAIMDAGPRYEDVIAAFARATGADARQLDYERLTSPNASVASVQRAIDAVHAYFVTLAPAVPREFTRPYELVAVPEPEPDDNPDNPDNLEPEFYTPFDNHRGLYFYVLASTWIALAALVVAIPVFSVFSVMRTPCEAGSGALAPLGGALVVSLVCFINYAIAVTVEHAARANGWRQPANLTSLSALLGIRRRGYTMLAT